MERHDQLGRRNGLLGHVTLESCNLRSQRDETECVYVEDTALMFGGRRAVVVRSLFGIVIVTMICRVVVGSRIQCHCMDRIKMLARKIMRMRRLSSGGAGPDKRSSHKGRHDATHESHGS